MLTILKRATATSLQGKRREVEEGQERKGAEQEPYHHFHMKPEENGVEYAEWKFHHHYLQASNAAAA
jgi:hypothetical protein